MHKNTCKINENTTIVYQYEINDVWGYLHAGIQYKSSGKTYNVTFLRLLHHQEECSARTVVFSIYLYLMLTKHF